MVTYPLEATLEICADQCRAKCCHRPLMYLADSEIPLFPSEMIFDRVEFETEVWEAETGGFLRLDGPCPHLTAEYACGIYEKRPKSCREFPYGPTPGCLLWPMP